jgi:hypothetical protein
LTHFFPFFFLKIGVRYWTGFIYGFFILLAIRLSALSVDPMYLYTAANLVFSFLAIAASLILVYFDFELVYYGYQPSVEMEDIEMTDPKAPTEPKPKEPEKPDATHLGKWEYVIWGLSALAFGSLLIISLEVLSSPNKTARWVGLDPFPVNFLVVLFSLLGLGVSEVFNPHTLWWVVVLIGAGLLGAVDGEGGFVGGLLLYLALPTAWKCIEEETKTVKYPTAWYLVMVIWNAAWLLAAIGNEIQSPQKQFFFFFLLIF